jgi:hypothetical protein
MSEFEGSITPPPVREVTNRVEDVSGVSHEVGGDLRMWNLLRTLEHNLRHMNRQELQGALLILAPLHVYLNRIYFEEQKDFNRRSLVKTIEELFEIGMEIDIHGGFVSSDGEDSE